MGNATSGSDGTSVYKYNLSKQEWEVVTTNHENVTTCELKIVTLNQWFGKFALSERINGQIEELQKLNPDIICLQESWLSLFNFSLFLKYIQQFFRPWKYFVIMLGYKRIILLQMLMVKH